jgi:hypothetical protein
MMIAYRGKVLPKYSVASVPVGGVKTSELSQRLTADKLLPATITLVKDGQREPLSPSKVGVAADVAASRQRLEKSRSWLPFLCLFMHHSVPSDLTLNDSRFNAAFDELHTRFTKAPLPERIVFKNNNFAIAPPESGYEVQAKPLKTQLIASLEKGQFTVTVPTKTTISNAPTGQLQPELAELQKRLDVKFQLLYGGQIHTFSRAEIAGLYEPSDQTLRLSENKIKQVVAAAATSLSINPINEDEAVQALLYGANKLQPVNFVLAVSGVTVHHYCVGLKGVDGTALAGLRQKLAAVYGDPRGWNQAKIVFVYSESSCDYTVWLTAPNLMVSTFGDTCDNYYSCRVGANVVINYDRWQGATDPWNAAHGSLEDYRVMVINHETGHWLGFGHLTCPGSGQLAPVMQQQSISLQGCNFNPWPTAAEIAAL